MNSFQLIHSYKFDFKEVVDPFERMANDKDHGYHQINLGFRHFSIKLAVSSRPKHIAFN